MSTSSSPQPLAAGWVPVPGSPLYSAVHRYRPNCVSAKVPEVTAADPAESADTTKPPLRSTLRPWQGSGVAPPYRADPWKVGRSTRRFPGTKAMSFCETEYVAVGAVTTRVTRAPVPTHVASEEVKVGSADWT